MPDKKPADIWQLGDLSTPWSIHVAATLRIANHIEAGITNIAALAAASGSHQESLHRVLRHLVAQGVFEEPAPGTFALNDAARPFLDSATVLGFDLDSFGGRMAHAWNGLLRSVRTGEPTYHEIFGRSFWDDLAANPELGETFDDLMGPPGHGTPDPDIQLAGGWDSVRTVVDVGGGTGALLAEILRDRPTLRGILVDLPATVERSRTILEPAGVADRVTTVGQSFFDPLPAGGEVYLLKSILSDWPDREARLILERCAEAARPAASVVLLNGVSPDEGDGPSPDLLMLVLVGGKGRTLSEFRELARSAGLEVLAAGRQPSGRFVVECRPL